MIRYALGLIAVLLVSVGCFGGSGGDDEEEPGARDPQTAVRNLIEGIVAGDQARIEGAINPIYADKLGEVGVADIIELAELTKIEIEDLELTAEFDAERKHARVFVNGTVVSKEGEAELDNKVLLTSIQGDRWYVTSPNSEYWAGQLRPSPAAWQQVQLDANPTLPGTFVAPHPGADGKLLDGSTDDRSHVANDATIPICSEEQLASANVSNPLCYPSNPPTSGPHASSAAPFRVFPQPVGKEFLVHSMEHGGVVIWYNSSDPAVIQRLTAITETNIQRGKLVAMSFYGGMEADTVALTAWTRLDKFPATSNLNTDRIQIFINAHERRFNPEGF